MALYVLAIEGANCIAPIIGAFIAAGQGWKWVLVSSRQLSRGIKKMSFLTSVSTGVAYTPVLLSFSSSSSSKRPTTSDQW